MGANDIQVGGDHYRGRPIQHWDVIDRNGIGYLEGVATKYLCRYKDKNGVQDLRKAEHYIMKLMEEVQEHGRRPRGVAPMEEIIALKEGYDLNTHAFGAVHALLTWSHLDVLNLALKDVHDLIMFTELPASPPS